jgi:hypothetical protein
MMEQSGFLQTIAQVSIGLAGFAGVIAAFSKFKIAAKAVTYRVRLMVVLSLLTMLLSLLPFLLLEFGLSEECTWRVATGVFGVSAIPLLAWTWIGLRPLYKAGLLHTQPITAIQYTVGAVLIVALFASAAGFTGPLAAAVYLSGLFFCLVP